MKSSIVSYTPVILAWYTLGLSATSPKWHLKINESAPFMLTSFIWESLLVTIILQSSYCFVSPCLCPDAIAPMVSIFLWLLSIFVQMLVSLSIRVYIFYVCPELSVHVFGCCSWFDQIEVFWSLSVFIVHTCPHGLYLSILSIFV